MTLQQLEYVVALDTFRLFVNAAEKCFVTQPTLTMQIKKLEEETGVVIFNRNVKPLRPTREGEKIITHAYKVLREVNQMKEYLRNHKNILDHEYHIGVIPSLAPYLLPLFLPDFMKQYPHTRLKIHELKTHDIIQGLRTEEIQAALLVTPLNERDLEEIPLFEEAFLFYLPENHPLCSEHEITPNMINTSELLVLSEGHCFRNQTLHICRESAETHHQGFFYESGSIETLKRMVDKGMGYTLIPELSYTPTDISCRVKPFGFPKPVREVSLVCSYNFTDHVLTQKLAESILESLPDSFKTQKRGEKILVQ